MPKKTKRVNWEKDNPYLTLIVDEIQKAKKIDRKGNLSWNTFNYKTNITLLFDMLRFGNKIHEYDKRSIINQAVNTVGKRGNITPRKLINEINRQEEKYEASPDLEYVVSTELSIEKRNYIKSTQIHDSKIILSNHLPPKYEKDKRAAFKDSTGTVIKEWPRDYLAARVFVKSKTYSGAFNVALERLDLIRGIWNWFFNRRTSWRLTTGRRKPVNKIFLGPLFFLHKPGGSLATTYHWYELHYEGPYPVLKIGKDLSALRQFNSRIRSYLAYHKYRGKIETAIIRYSKALDEPNWDNAFLKLWSCLELLTNTTKTNNAKTVERAKFMYEYKDYHGQILDVLRKYRNSYVHLSEQHSEVETYMYLLKSVVEVLLNFHLVNHFKFTSMEEAAAFLDYPTNSEALRRKIRLAKHALHWIRD